MQNRSIFRATDTYEAAVSVLKHCSLAITLTAMPAVVIALAQPRPEVDLDLIILSMIALFVYTRQNRISAVALLVWSSTHFFAPTTYQGGIIRVLAFIFFTAISVRVVQVTFKIYREFMGATGAIENA